MADDWFAACIEDGVPQPKYTIHPEDIMIEFTAPADRIVRSGTSVTEKVTENEAKVITLLAEDAAYTATILAEKLGANRKTVSNRLKSLKEKGVIRRIGSDTKGYWEIMQE